MSHESAAIFAQVLPVIALAAFIGSVRIGHAVQKILNRALFSVWLTVGAEAVLLFYVMLELDMPWFVAYPIYAATVWVILFLPTLLLLKIGNDATGRN